MPRSPIITVLILDGTHSAHKTTDLVRKGVCVNLITATKVDSIAQLASSSIPDIAILGNDHPLEERRIAEGLLREMNPEIRIISL